MRARVECQAPTRADGYASLGYAVLKLTRGEAGDASSDARRGTDASRKKRDRIVIVPAQILNAVDERCSS